MPLRVVRVRLGAIFLRDDGHAPVWRDLNAKVNPACRCRG